MTLHISHLGICVSDPDRSEHFYTGALGFERVAVFEVGPEFGQLMEIDGVTVESRFLRRDGLAIELLHYLAPGPMGSGERRPVNQLGLTHICVRVDDVDEVAALVADHGGRVLDQTRTTFDPPDGPTMDFVYCTDPDGVRIELMRSPFAV
jgi:catechol 2,3-dioxygenase-like lactoylglutathione lyase family enzyme